MHYSQLLAIFALATLGAAKPTPANLARRACTIQLPSSYQQVSKASPIETYIPGSVFQASQEEGGTNDFNTIISFEGIPDGAYACQLNVAFNSLEGLTSFGNPQLNVYTVSNSVNPKDTYKTYFPDSAESPVGSLWGTGTVGEATVVFNSESCASDLAFLFSVASEIEAGFVAFTDKSARNGTVINGFYLTYNC